MFALLFLACLIEHEHMELALPNSPTDITLKLSDGKKPELALSN